MSEQFLASGDRHFSISAKDVLAIGFRRKRLITVCFAAVFLGAVLVSIFLPASYQAHTKLLVKRERVDPVITPGQDAQVVMRDDVTEEELNSEVELLESDDVLRQVVVACGLQNRHSWFAFGKNDEAERIAKSIKRLRSGLQVEVMKKTNLIAITYSSDDPKLAANVLNNLNETYIQKNAEVHRPQGQYKFFEQEAERYKTELNQAEQQLKQFASQDGVAPQIARDQTLQKLAEFNATLGQTRAEMAATEQKIHTLETQSNTLPARITTQLRETDDAQLLQQLKSTLMSLELKRTELLTKFQPDYPLVQEVDKEIADTRAAISSEESKPVKEQTTDQNPTYQYVSTELAKAKADYSALQARAAATEAIVALYRSQAEQLEQKGIVQQDLLRMQKTDEENYLLYLRKREEARISDALDQRRILNMAVAEQPVAPVLPSRSPWLIIGLGLVIGLVTSTGMALTADYLDPSFRTPTEVFDELKIPVLAAVPFQRTTPGVNGNGNGNGAHGGRGNSGAGSSDAEISQVQGQ
jgi:uncharacterized protein involved in exopolysaccharide biosynthesis